MMFVCQNSLLASLTDCETTKKRTNMLKMAFGDRQVTAALGKDFEQFLKRVCKQLKNKELNETFHAKDLVGGYRYSMVASKKPSNSLRFRSFGATDPFTKHCGKELTEAFMA